MLPYQGNDSQEREVDPIASLRPVEKERVIAEEQKREQDNLVVLPLKKQEPVALFNRSLLGYCVLILAIITFSGLFLSSRASYLYSVSRATEDLQKEMVVLSNQNDMLRIKVEEVTSLETITERALEMGFGLPEAHQIYEMPKLAERSIN